MTTQQESTPELPEDENFLEGAPKIMTPKQKLILFGALGTIVVCAFGTLAFGKSSEAAPAKKGPAALHKHKDPENPEAYERSIPRIEERSVPVKDSAAGTLSSILTPEPSPPLLAENSSGQIPIQPTYAARGNGGGSESESPGSTQPRGPRASREGGAHMVPASFSARLDPSYQTMVKHLKSVKSEALEPPRRESESRIDRTALVDSSLRNLYAGATQEGFPFTLPAGTRIIAASDQKVSTDHPGFFTSTILRPEALDGAKLICASGSNLNDRIPVKPVKIIMSSGQEIPLSGQVETDFPGLDGNVTSHWFKRLAPAVTNAAIGGAFAYWALSQKGSDERIDTRDMVVAPIIQSSVQGVQNEITRLGGDTPNTVDVSAGQQFSVLLTEPLNLRK